MTPTFADGAFAEPSAEFVDLAPAVRVSVTVGSQVDLEERLLDDGFDLVLGLAGRHAPGVCADATSVQAVKRTSLTRAPTHLPPRRPSAGCCSRGAPARVTAEVWARVREAGRSRFSPTSVLSGTLTPDRHDPSEEHRAMTHRPAVIAADADQGDPCRGHANLRPSDRGVPTGRGL